MQTQLMASALLGLLGLIYLLAYERVVMAPGLRRYGTDWVARRKLRWWRQRDTPVSLMWPGMEEAMVRGIPMLLIQNRLYLLLALLAANAAFTLGHLDSDTIGIRRWLLRYSRGLVYSAPALFGQLWLCVLLHAGWNLASSLHHWYRYPDDRIVIWTEGPLEVLITAEAQASNSRGHIFRNQRSVCAQTIKEV